MLSDSRQASVVYTVAALVAANVSWLFVWLVASVRHWRVTISFASFGEHLIEGAILAVLTALGVRAVIILQHDGLGGGGGG